MRNITETDFQTYKKIVDDFSGNVIDHSGLSDGAAEKKFMDNLSKGEIVKLVATKLRSDFSKNAAPEKKSRRLLSYCEATVPGLTKAFGEQALVDAMPEQARSQDMADLTRELGGVKIARLIELGLPEPEAA